MSTLRDAAWARDAAATTPRRHVELWRDLVRRAPATCAAPGRRLLAFAAWQAGDGALAWCAIDRCRAVDPDYRWPHCVAQALTGAVPPAVWDRPR